MSLVADTERTLSIPAPLRGRIARYVSLLKLRPMSVVIYSAVVGLIVAPGSIGLLTAVIAVLCIAVGGAGSAALNMWYEADLDARMVRTSGRVLPSGKLRARNALLLGSAMCVGSVIVMALAVNTVAAVMLAATIGAYFGLYTVVLKRRTSLNVLIGGSLAGLLTPLTGWAAAAGTVDTAAIAMFLFVLFWTPPHVWSQAVYRVADYQRAGVPMLPATAGISATTFWIMVFTVLHVAASALPWFAGLAGPVYPVIAAAGGAVLIWKALQLQMTGDRHLVMARSRRFFRLSIFYVTALLTALAAEAVIMST